MARAIIIDDEQNCIEVLKNDLAMYCPRVSIDATCRSGKEGVLAIKQFRPDIVFLDVEMPWMNGFEMLDMLDNITFKVIFTTAYDQFAVQAIRASAVDYLMKPIDSTELIQAVQRAEKLLHEKAANENVTNLLSNVKLPLSEQKIAVPIRHGYDFIPVNNILYCRADGRYTYIVLTDRQVLLTKSLGETVPLLPKELFERVHHSLLVNVNYIRQYQKKEGNFIIMSNGDELTVSKIKKDALLKRLGV